MLTSIRSIEGVYQSIHYYTYRTHKVPNCLFPNVNGTMEHSLPLHVTSSKWRPRDGGGSF